MAMILIDLALAVMILSGALFLGVVALRLFKEEVKKNDSENTPKQ